MPRPKKRKGESFQQRVSRLVSYYRHEGYPQEQAVAIAYSVARKERRTKRKNRRTSRR